VLDRDKSDLSLDKLSEKVGVTIFEQFDTNYKKPVDLLFADERFKPYSVYYHVKRDGVLLYER